MTDFLRELCIAVGFVVIALAVLFALMAIIAGIVAKFDDWKWRRRQASSRRCKCGATYSLTSMDGVTWRCPICR